MKYNSLGDRMKGYENISRIYLTKRSPVIIRIDGKAFHSFTKGFLRPFDNILMETMAETAKFLAQNISGCKLAYTQSDEISLLLTDYETNETQPWFENNLQKLVSVSASMATLHFNRIFANNWIVKDIYEVDEKLPLGHGEKSCLIIQKYFPLSMDEVLAIRWHMGGFDAAAKGGDYGLSKAQDISKLVTLISVADLIASNLFEETKK